MAGILPPGLQGYVAAEQNARNAGTANLQQALGILNASHQIAQQEQEAQVNPLRIGLLRAQLDKANADLQLQQDATAAMGNGLSDTDRLRQVGLRYGLAGHPGAAGILKLAEQIDDHKMQSAAMNQLQSMTTPNAPAPAGVELTDMGGASRGPSAVPGVSGLLAPGNGPSPSELQKMAELDKAGVPIDFKQASPQNLAISLAQAKVPAAIAGPLIPPTQYQQERLDIERTMRSE